MRVVGHTVAVSGRNIWYSNIKGAINPKRDVFLAFSAQRAVIIAAPRVEHSIARESYCVHTAAGHFDDGFSAKVRGSHLENL